MCKLFCCDSLGIIDVKELTIEYDKGKKTVHKCNFSVNRGEVFGLLGSNGAGKSTILKTFAGINKRYSGKIKMFDKDVQYQNGDIFREVSYIPQHHCMFKDFTVKENLEYFASMEGLSGERKRIRIEEVLNMFFLKPFEKRQVAKLSGGYRQLLNIALSMIIDRKIILMDEPTAGLDIWTKQKIMEYIKELRRNGKTVIFTTHDLDDAQDLCDNVLIISDGKILGRGNIHELLQKMGGGYSVHVYIDDSKGLKELKLKYSTQFAVFNNHIVIETSPKNVGLAIKELVTKLQKVKIKITEIEVREPSLSYVFSSLMYGSEEK
jgi:ABC-2 type transport system ATP-binding protein